MRPGRRAEGNRKACLFLQARREPVGGADDEHRRGLVLPPPVAQPPGERGAAHALAARIQDHADRPQPEEETQSRREWNSSKLVIKDDHVEHWLNDIKVVEYQWDSPEVRDLIKKSKFKDMPGFMKQKSGHVAFQHHGEEAWFRNIRIRRL